MWAIIVGLVLGLIAKAILPGKQRIPLLLRDHLRHDRGGAGQLGASGLGCGTPHGIDWIRHVLQVIGAVVVVALGTGVWVACARPSLGRLTPPPTRPFSISPGAPPVGPASRCARVGRGSAPAPP
ncbi:hypothetical protein GCM10020221_28220 [Streptomyces thioluteus]|uniref:Uncharacterized protein n=1 Tax=Streptomyces thioluteus TaxID=66431 RepID=A0ABP6JEQ8_STRTU